MYTAVGEQRVMASRKDELWDAKEKTYLDEPTTITCPDDSHPRFTIQVTKEKPVAVCYYCSKTWILDKDKYYSVEFWKGRAG